MSLNTPKLQFVLEEASDVVDAWESGPNPDFLTLENALLSKMAELTDKGYLPVTLPCKCCEFMGVGLEVDHKYKTVKTCILKRKLNERYH